VPTTAPQRKRTGQPRSAAAAPSRGTSATAKPDVIALIKADHAAVDQLFRRYKGLSERALKARRQIAERVIKELSVHAAVEEQVLYPNARAAIPNGKSLVKEAIDEHQAMKKTLAALDKCAPESEKFHKLMTDLQGEVRHHVREEEAPGGILSLLRKNASRDELQQMATLTRTAKKAAPTRPHPKAPSTPPGNLVVGMAAAVVDRARDRLGGRAR
jgi:hemerythrin superfamily protein